MQVKGLVVAIAAIAVLIALHTLIPLPRLPIAGEGELLQRRGQGTTPAPAAVRSTPDTVFFQGRNSIEIKVPRAMEVDALIRMDQIEKSRSWLERGLNGRQQLRKAEKLGPIPLTPPTSR
jgi:hypothetical protein